MGIYVISGGTSGVGRACVRLAASRGHDIGILGRTKAALDDAVKEVGSCGRQGLALQVDVANPEAVFDAASQVERELGPIDVWINNAMVTVFAPVDEVSPDEFRRVTEVNYLGYVNGSLAALRHMKPRNRGVIVHVGSALAYRSIPLQSAYCASKAAIRGFHESLRCELRHDKSGVHSTMVQLPAVNTPQFDVGRNKMGHKPQPVKPIFAPEVAADSILYAAEHPRREYLVAGSSLRAVIGQRLMPNLLERLAARMAWKGQLSPDPENPSRPDNLDEPTGDDLGATGRYTAEMKGRSVAWDATKVVPKHDDR